MVVLDLRRLRFQRELEERGTLELVRAGAAVAFMPDLILPVGDPALAVRDIAEATLRRRLAVVTRDGPPTPALSGFLDVLRGLSPSSR